MCKWAQTRSLVNVICFVYFENCNNFDIQNICKNVRITSYRVKHVNFFSQLLTFILINAEILSNESRVLVHAENT